MTEGTGHVFQMPGFLFEDLMRCHSSWVHNRSEGVTKACRDEAVETCGAAKAWVAMTKPFTESDASARGDGWFLRLSEVDPKDSPFGKRLVRCVTDVVLQLASGMRA